MSENNENLFNNQVFVNNLKYYMKEKGVTQKEIAEILGMSQGAISDWMNWRSYPRMDKLQKLAEFFEVEKSDLVEDKSVKSKYFLYKKVNALEKKLRESPEAVELFIAIEELSSEDREMVKAFIDRLRRSEN